MLLSVLSGQTRYAHITGIRQDAVNPYVYTYIEKGQNTLSKKWGPL